MKITFLGTGTSQGVPVIGCDCEVCTSLDFRNKRFRTSIFIETEEQNLVIDTGPDFRMQMLRLGAKKLDGVLYTHEHKDHTAGLDDIRPFNFAQKKDMAVYAQKQVIEQIKREFAYAFSPKRYPGVPKINSIEIDEKPFFVGKKEIIPIPVMHHKLPVLGFRIGDFSYITDANHIPEKSLDLIKGSKVLVLNALQKSPHLSHFTLEEAIEIAKASSVPKTYFTHMSHRLGLHSEVSEELPEGIDLAYDGLEISLD